MTDNPNRPDTTGAVLLPCPACGVMSAPNSGAIPQHRRERAAIALWHRFAPNSSLEWENEMHQAEYRLAVDAIVEALNGRE